MKMKTLLILFILNIACSNSAKITNNSKSNNLKEDNHVMKMTLKRNYVKIKEEANFKIKNITQLNQSLDIFVTYSGGCGEEHQFELITNGKIDKSGVIDFYLVDHTKGDNCKMMLMQTKHFDISKVSKKKKITSFRVNDGKINAFKK